MVRDISGLSMEGENDAWQCPSPTKCDKPTKTSSVKSSSPTKTGSGKSPSIQRTAAKSFKKAITSFLEVQNINMNKNKFTVPCSFDSARALEDQWLSSYKA